MKARAMNSKAVVAAAMMTMAAMATSPAAADPSLMGLSHAVATRTVLDYGQGAWTAPAAVVLKSEQDWTNWNKYMADHGMAVGPESMPSGVNWSTDALLVVSLGQNLNADYSVTVASAQHTGSHTTVTLNVTAGQGGSSPCVVVAMNRNLASDVSLVGANGVPAVAQQYSSASLQASGSPAGGSVATTWGALKSAYHD